MSLLILMRHGQSMWNAANLFTGWVDVPLTNKGIEEAIQGGKETSHLPIDEVHTSTLIRAQMTAMLALAQRTDGKVPVFQYPESETTEDGNAAKMARWSQSNDSGENTLPVFVSWQLNERMYGDLQGLDKQETRDKYGDDQVHIWRRSYDIPPPNGESLQLTAARTIPYLEEKIIPALEAGKNIFIAAHGNSLRSIVMSIEKLSTEEVLGLEIPTGKPIVYEFNNSNWSRI
jgi:2,3-bisphosphoglycerate-dependent phosphoglycerate mutase